MDVQSLAPKPVGSESSTRGRILPSDALTIGGATVVAYATTFVYEAGYLGHFGIPIWLIDLDLNRVFVAAGGLTLVGGIVFWTLRVLPDRPAVLGLLFERFVLPLLLLTLVVIIALDGQPGPWKWSAAGFFGLMFAMYIGVYWVAPIKRFRSDPKWISRIARDKESDDRQSSARDPNTLWNRVAKRVYRAGYDAYFYWWAGFAFYGLLYAAHVMGGFQASHQKFFLSRVYDGTEVIALRQYRDSWLCVQLDSTHTRVLPKILVILASADTAVEWNIYHFKSLSVVPPSDRPARSAIETSTPELSTSAPNAASSPASRSP